MFLVNNLSNVLDITIAGLSKYNLVLTLLILNWSKNLTQWFILGFLL